MLLGLGSSVSLAYLRAAVRKLKALPGLRITRVSPIYASDAMLPPGAPASWEVPYFNLVVRAEADAALSPEDWLGRVKEIERALGRRERERWAPREIDIDLLAWGDRRWESAVLRLPHVGIAQRPFVVLPLADVAPEWRHPTEAAAIETAREKWSGGRDVPFRTHRTSLSLTELAGIVNLTPDSFSDGGRMPPDPSAAAERLLRWVDEGASLLDVGAESTRPGATTLDPNEEFDRLLAYLPVLERVREARPSVRWSLDSRHPETVRKARALFPWDIVNDVGGFADPRMWEAAAGAPEIVVMHSLGVPPTRERTLPETRPAIEAILEWGDGKLREAERRGFAKDRVSLDPGLGFGKTPEQNFALVRAAARAHALGAALWFGHSRKSFLGGGARGLAAERDPETAALSAELAAQGVEVLRVHAPAANARALGARASQGRPQEYGA